MELSRIEWDCGTLIPWSRIELWHGAIGHRFGYRSRRGQWQRGTFGWTTSKTRVTTNELRYSLASGTHLGLKKGRISNKCDLDPRIRRMALRPRQQSREPANTTLGPSPPPASCLVTYSCHLLASAFHLQKHLHSRPLGLQCRYCHVITTMLYRKDKGPPEGP